MHGKLATKTSPETHTQYGEHFHYETSANKQFHLISRIEPRAFTHSRFPFWMEQCSHRSCAPVHTHIRTHKNPRKEARTLSPHGKADGIKVNRRTQNGLETNGFAIRCRCLLQYSLLGGSKTPPLRLGVNCFACLQNFTHTRTPSPTTKQLTTLALDSSWCVRACWARAVGSHAQHFRASGFRVVQTITSSNCLFARHDVVCVCVFVCGGWPKRGVLRGANGFLHCII
uniref:Uncharacterized protein n=1 Tax=Anopheles funestus TaxID=62324 RepID=A0A182S0S1_ANOFN